MNLNDTISSAIKFNYPPISQDIINKFYEKLGIKFSDNFLSIARKTSFDYFQMYEFDNFDDIGTTSVIENTLRLRASKNLPTNLLALYESDTSMLLMRCLGFNEEIFLIEIEDFDNFCSGNNLIYNYQYYDCFVNFMRELISFENQTQ